MRKRRMEWTAWGAVLAALALTGAMAGRAAAQSTERPWLGVSTQEITSDLREGLDYRGSGVLVTSVVADSPADRAGLEKGDVLVSLNSRTIDTPSELVEVVRAARIGQSVSLAIIRDGQRRSLTARLSARSGDADYYDVPTPRAPKAPSAPRAPVAPRARMFEWDGESFDMPDLKGLTMLRGMGRGRLGIHIQDLNADMADALGVTGGKGVLVTEVIEDTPAASVGIKAGDVITEVGGQAVEDVNDLHRELGEREGKVSITLVRRGARRTVEPELEARRQVTHWESDRDGIRDRKVIRVPDVRRRVERDVRDRDSSRDDLEQQMRELREELRELRRKVEAAEKP